MSDGAKVVVFTLCCGLAGCKFGDTPEGMFHQASAFGIGVFSCERCHGEAKGRDRSLVDSVP